MEPFFDCAKISGAAVSRKRGGHKTGAGRMCGSGAQKWDRGEELKSRGCFSLTSMSAEGNVVTQNFEDTDVDMPIMSVGELSANGDLGSNVLFGERDGHLVDIKTNATSKFYRRRGVYFMKLFVPKDKVAEPDFGRPGSA